MRLVALLPLLLVGNDVEASGVLLSETKLEPNTQYLFSNGRNAYLTSSLKMTTQYDDDDDDATPGIFTLDFKSDNEFTITNFETRSVISETIAGTLGLNAGNEHSCRFTLHHTPSLNNSSYIITDSYNQYLAIENNALSLSSIRENTWKFLSLERFNNTRTIYDNYDLTDKNKYLIATRRNSALTYLGVTVKDTLELSNKPTLWEVSSVLDKIVIMNVQDEYLKPLFSRNEKVSWYENIFMWWHEVQPVFVLESGKLLLTLDLEPRNDGYLFRALEKYYLHVLKSEDSNKNQEVVMSNYDENDETNQFILISTFY